MFLDKQLRERCNFCRTNNKRAIYYLNTLADFGFVWYYLVVKCNKDFRFTIDYLDKDKKPFRADLSRN